MDKEKNITLIKKIENVQKEFPNLTLPNMGVLNNEKTVNINNNNYIKNTETSISNEKKLNNKGQTLVEYVLIISLITVIAIAAVRIFGGYLKDSITKVSCDMIGKKYVESKTIGKAYCEGDEDRIFE